MIMLNLLAEKIATLEQTAQQLENFSEFVRQFQQSWLEMGRQLQEHLTQERIHQLETGRKGCRQIRTRAYHTPLGTIKLGRRIYQTESEYQCLVDQKLCLPQDAWKAEMLENWQSHIEYACPYSDQSLGSAVGSNHLIRRKPWLGFL